MNAHTILEIGAWTFGALAVLLLSGGFVLGPAGERVGAHLYRRESDRLAAGNPPRLRMRSRIAAFVRRPFDWLKARNERILREREERR